MTVTADAPDYFVHPTSIVDEGAVVGAGTKIWHFCHVTGGARIGRACSLGQNVFVGGKAVIGHGVKVQNNVSIYDRVTLEDEVFCGPSMVFTNVLTPRAHVSRKHDYAPTCVRRGATIGANATVVCPVEIGRYAMVGAGAVVTRDVPDFALVYGSPARPRGWVSRAGEILHPDAGDGRCACPLDGSRYRLVDGALEALDSE